MRLHTQGARRRRPRARARTRPALQRVSRRNSARLVVWGGGGKRRRLRGCASTSPREPSPRVRPQRCGARARSLEWRRPALHRKWPHPFGLPICPYVTPHVPMCSQISSNGSPGSDDTSVRVWDAKALAPLCSLSGHKQVCDVLAVFVFAQFVYIQMCRGWWGYGCVCVFRSPSIPPLQHPLQHPPQHPPQQPSQAVHCLCVHSERLYSGSADQTIRVWSIASLKCLRQKKKQSHDSRFLTDSHKCAHAPQSHTPTCPPILSHPSASPAFSHPPRCLPSVMRFSPISLQDAPRPHGCSHVPLGRGRYAGCARLGLA